MGRKKKFERFKVTEVKNRSGNPSWRVSGTKSSGERVRENFKVFAKARARKGELDMEDAGLQPQATLQQTTLTSEELRQAESALGLVRGRALPVIVAEYLDLEKRAAKHNQTAASAMAFFERHYAPDLEELSILTAVKRFLASREERREKTQAYYGTATNLILTAVDPNTLVHQIKLEDLEKILCGYKNRNTRQTYKRSWHTFFEWCLKRRHVLENPVKRMDTIEPETSEIAILSLDEIKRLLTGAMQLRDGRFAPYIAIGLFAGLRPSEIQDLNAKDIRDGEILVSGGKLRRKHSRRVPVPTVLDKWLEVFPFKGCPRGLQRNFRHLRDATAAQRWVQDIVRHTSISFQLEQDKDEAATAFHNGTSKSMLNRHYRQVVENKADIKAFWELTPEKVKSLKLRVKLPKSDESVDWPSKAKLKKMVEQKPVSQIAKEFGLSDNAIRKHCLRIGIELPERGYWQKRRAGKLEA